MTVLDAARAQATRLPLLPRCAAGASIAGLLSAVSVLPTPVKALLLAAFVFLGPGAVLVYPYRDRLPGRTVWVLVPLGGLSVVILVTTATVFFVSWFRPLPLLFAMAVATLAAALLLAVRDNTLVGTSR